VDGARIFNMTFHCVEVDWLVEGRRGQFARHDARIAICVRPLESWRRLFDPDDGDGCDPDREQSAAGLGADPAGDRNMFERLKLPHFRVGLRTEHAVVIQARRF
jgi:hypothetical protein